MMQRSYISVESLLFVFYIPEVFIKVFAASAWFNYLIAYVLIAFFSHYVLFYLRIIFAVKKEENEKQTDKN
jgi:predicted ABC-type exoprotein transport system permease subunit